MTSQAHATTLDPGRPPEPRALRPVDIDAAADAARMLVALHERVERQFEAYEAAEGSHSARRRAVAAVARALATHVAVEDELLYPALRDHTGRHDPEIERQLQQDHLLDLVMVELGGMLPADRGYDGKVRVLMQVFRQHARDAEALLLPELRRRLGPAERELLGRRVLERVGQLEHRPRRGW
jgi:Hemerythrin HHE cation binding domain